MVDFLLVKLSQILLRIYYNKFVLNLINSKAGDIIREINALLIENQKYIYSDLNKI